MNHLDIARASCEGREGTHPALRPNGSGLMAITILASDGGSNPPCGTRRFMNLQKNCMKMKTEKISLDTRVANALVARITEERWPVHIQLGIPFRTENGNHMADVTVEYEDDFPFGEKLDDTINRVFNLTTEEP